MSLRLVHVVDGEAGDEPLLACGELVRDDPRNSHTICLVGTSRGSRRARDLGLEVRQRWNFPIVCSSLAGRSARRTLAQSGVDGCDVTVAWSVRSAGLTRRLFGTPTFVALAGSPGSSPALGALAPCTPFTWCPSALTDWRSRGLTDIRLVPRPRPTLAGVTGASVRSALHLDPRRRLIGLLADPPSAGDVRTFAFVLGLIATAGHAVAGIVGRGGQGDRRAARFVRAHHRRWGLLQVDQPLAHVLGACDAVVWDGRPQGTALAAACVELGIPVVAMAPTGRHAYPPSVEGVVNVPGREPGAVGAAMLPFFDGSAAAPARGARAEGTARFAGAMRAIWRERLALPRDAS